MKENKHPPGPWRTDSANGLRVVVGNQSTVAWIDFWVTPECQKQKSLAEQDANAQLIASAPELLGALEKLLESYEAYVDVDSVTNADIANPVDNARQAIAKAKGGV